MSISLSGPVSSLVELALNASAMRHDVIANNIANVNTPGYKPLQVNFEEQINQMMSAEMIHNDDNLENLISTVTPELIEQDYASGTNQLDIEMVNMAKNTLHYQTLLKGLSSYGSITKMAIKEGKS
ncbi:MAG: flagellar basal body rod protein FlgB [Gammaproteobacteria bacterium]|nr:flagellar basal body rod protein FlgB [Gammaproteobacteria bacterium]